MTDFPAATIPPRTVTYVSESDEHGSVLSRSIRFTYAATAEVPDTYADALTDDWLTRSLVDQHAEMDSRYLAWVAARQPAPDPPSNEEQLQAAQVDAAQQVLTAQSALIAAQQAALDAGFVPSVPVNVQQTVPVDTPVVPVDPPVVEAPAGPA